MSEPSGARQMVCMHQRNCKTQGQLFTMWDAMLEPDQTIDDALDPTFWKHLADQFMGQDKKGGRGALVELRSHDFTSGWTLQIVELGKGYVKMIKRTGVEMQPPVLPEASPLEWKWNTSRKAYDVRRKDGVVVSQDHQTKDAAKAWIDQHTKAMAA